MLDFSLQDVLLLLLLAANVLIGVMVLQKSQAKRQRREQDAARDAARIAHVLRDYFHRTGVDVSAECTSLDGGQRFTALIESEPMKRFRLSHIIEATLIEYVRKNCQLELEKIYWRFPINEAVLRAEPTAVAVAAATATASSAPPTADAAIAAIAASAAEETDDYINEGLNHYKTLPKLEAEEVSWETFQQMSGAALEKK